MAASDLMAKKRTEDDKAFAILGVALPIVGYIIMVLAKRGGPYAVFYGKQGVVLGVAGIIVAALGNILAWLPVIGWMLHTALSVGWMVLWIIAIVYSLSDKLQEIPLIGEYGRKF